MVYKGIFILIQPCKQSQKLNVILGNNFFSLPKILKIVGEYNHNIRIVEYNSQGFYKLLERGVRYGHRYGSVYHYNGIYLRDPPIYYRSSKEQGGKNDFYFIIFELERVSNEMQDKLGLEFIILISVTNKLFREVNF